MNANKCNRHQAKDRESRIVCLPLSIPLIVVLQLADEGVHVLVQRSLMNGVPVVVGGTVTDVNAVTDRMLKESRPNHVYKYDIDMYIPSAAIGAGGYHHERKMLSLLSTSPMTNRVYSVIVQFYWCVNLSAQMRQLPAFSS